MRKGLEGKLEEKEIMMEATNGMETLFFLWHLNKSATPQQGGTINREKLYEHLLTISRSETSVCDPEKMFEMHHFCKCGFIKWQLGGLGFCKMRILKD